MKTTAATLALAVAFLSVGALAGIKYPAGQAQQLLTNNVTIVEKNQAWPPAGWAEARSCQTSRCIAI